MNIPTKVRWKIVYPLNKVTPWCWADLVGWAIDGEREQLQSARTSFKTCQSGPDTQREGSCYCGKYRRSSKRTIK